MRRFTILSLMGVVLGVAVAAAALRSANDYWAGGLLVATVILIGTAARRGLLFGPSACGSARLYGLRGRPFCPRVPRAVRPDPGDAPNHVAADVHSPSRCADTDQPARICHVSTRPVRNTSDQYGRRSQNSSRPATRDACGICDDGCWCRRVQSLEVVATLGGQLRGIQRYRVLPIHAACWAAWYGLSREVPGEAGPPPRTRRLIRPIPRGGRSAARPIESPGVGTCDRSTWFFVADDLASGAGRRGGDSLEKFRWPASAGAHDDRERSADRRSFRSTWNEPASFLSLWTWK